MAETNAIPGREEPGPGLLMVLQPKAVARAIIERAVNRSASEHTAKDFIDLLENVGVLLQLGPAGPGHLSPEENTWRGSIDPEPRGQGLERDIRRGDGGRAFVLVYVRDGDNGPEIGPWRELTGRMIGKFF